MYINNKLYLIFALYSFIKFIVSTIYSIPVSIYNFFLPLLTGMNINLCLRRLQSLSNFIKSAASAQTESSILQTLKKRHNHIRYVQQDFIRHGLKRTIFS